MTNTVLNELSLQLVSDPVVDAYKETKHLLKTDFPEIRFADNHERIGIPLFVKINKEGPDCFCHR